MNKLTNAVATAFRKAKRWLYRSSVTGRFVTEKFADGNPDTTTKEKMK